MSTSYAESPLNAWNLADRAALVVADEPGWTRVLAAGLGECGAGVAVASLTETAALEGAEHARQKGARALGFQASGTTDEGCRAAVERVVSEFGRLDVLVTVPQFCLASAFLEDSETSWSELMDRNVTTTLRWLQAAGRVMLEQGHGHIVNVISTLAERGVANLAPFTATQAAVQAATRSLALEWARSGVRVNAVAIGWHELERTSLEDQRQERLVRYLPLRRKGHPADVAALVAYLSSDASGFVTGQTIHVDGGAMAHA